MEKSIILILIASFCSAYSQNDLPIQIIKKNQILLEQTLKELNQLDKQLSKSLLTKKIKTKDSLIIQKSKQDLKSLKLHIEKKIKNTKSKTLAAK